MPVPLPVLFLIFIINLKSKLLLHFPGEDIKTMKRSNISSQESIQVCVT